MVGCTLMCINAQPAQLAAGDMIGHRAWGTKTNLFHQGVAKEVDDPDVIAATMRKPGAILRRPIGSNGPFKEHADLPTHLSRDEVKGRPRKLSAKKKQPPRKIDDKTARKATLAFEREQRQRESERKQRSKRPSGNTRSGQAQSKASARRSRNGRRRRTPVGKSKERSWRWLYGAHLPTNGRKRKTPCRYQVELREPTRVYSPV